MPSRTKTRRRKPPGTAIDKAKREAMWAAYQNRPVVEFVARECRVSPGTVRKYRRRDRWDQRLEEVERKAQAKADDVDAMSRAKRLVMARKLARATFDKVVSKKGKLLVDASVSDVEKAFHLVERLEADPVVTEFVGNLVQVVIQSVQVHVENPEARQRIRTAILGALETGQGLAGGGEPD